MARLLQPGLLASLIVLAALPTQRVVSGQVIMLPTYRTFTVGGSVLVPDRGMAHLGGISRMRESRTSRGVPGLAQMPMLGRLFGNRAIGRDAGHAGVLVAAEILDLKELDEQVLAQAAARGLTITAQDLEVGRKAAYLSRNVVRSNTARPAPQTHNAPGGTYLDQLRQQNALADQEQQLEGMTLWMQAQKMELEGKPGIARIYYQQAARRLSGTQRSQVIARLRHLEAVRSAAANRP